VWNANPLVYLDFIALEGKARQWSTFYHSHAPGSQSAVFEALAGRVDENLRLGIIEGCINQAREMAKVLGRPVMSAEQQRVCDDALRFAEWIRGTAKKNESAAAIANQCLVCREILPVEHDGTQRTMRIIVQTWQLEQGVD
jgi:hypothetical protein